MTADRAVPAGRLAAGGPTAARPAPSRPRRLRRGRHRGARAVPELRTAGRALLGEDGAGVPAGPPPGAGPRDSLRPPVPAAGPDRGAARRAGPHRCRSPATRLRTAACSLSPSGRAATRAIRSSSTSCARAGCSSPVHPAAAARRPWTPSPSTCAPSEPPCCGSASRGADAAPRRCGRTSPGWTHATRRVRGRGWRSWPGGPRWSSPTTSARPAEWPALGRAPGRRRPERRGAGRGGEPRDSCRRTTRGRSPPCGAAGAGLLLCPGPGDADLLGVRLPRAPLPVRPGQRLAGRRDRAWSGSRSRGAAAAPAPRAVSGQSSSSAGPISCVAYQASS